MAAIEASPVPKKTTGFELSPVFGLVLFVFDVRVNPPELLPDEFFELLPLELPDELLEPPFEPVELPLFEPPDEPDELLPFELPEDPLFELPDDLS